MVPPISSIALLAITSFAFMLDWVPEPVCQTTKGKLSSNLPSITSEAASMIAVARALSKLPSSRLASAQARLITPKARIIAIGWRSHPIGKFKIERCVWAPQYFV